MPKKFSKCGQNAHRESFGTSSNNRVPRIRTLRDRINRGMTVYRAIPPILVHSKIKISQFITFLHR